MLVKINKYTKSHVNVTELDIDEFGSIIPLRDLELIIFEHSNSLYELITQSSYAAIFTNKDLKRTKEQEFGEDSNIILLVNPITIEELNKEKERIIESIHKNT
ncbi:MAG: hypothetical protein AB7F53_04940 [Nitrososphaeraceae archaeon]